MDWTDTVTVSRVVAAHRVADGVLPESIASAMDWDAFTSPAGQELREIAERVGGRLLFDFHSETERPVLNAAGVPVYTIVGVLHIPQMIGPWPREEFEARFHGDPPCPDCTAPHLEFIPEPEPGAPAWFCRHCRRCWGWAGRDLGRFTVDDEALVL